MKTFYFGDGFRIHWQKPTVYRKTFGFEAHKYGKSIYLWWLVLEHEHYAVAMIRHGIAIRKRQ